MRQSVNAILVSFKTEHVRMYLYLLRVTYKYNRIRLIVDTDVYNQSKLVNQRLELLRKLLELHTDKRKDPPHLI